MSFMDDGLDFSNNNLDSNNRSDPLQRVGSITKSRYPNGNGSKIRGLGMNEILG